MRDLETLARQARRAIELAAKYAARTEMTENEALEIPEVFEEYKAGKQYEAGDIIKYGANADGASQLYQVAQAHISQADWKPDATPALYRPVGFTDGGAAVWVKPTGAHDAYNTGDKVLYNGKIYVSLIDGNVYSPDEYPAGWREAEA